MYKDSRLNNFWFFLSVVVSLMIFSAFGAPTPESPSQLGEEIPDIVFPESITFNITETYRGHNMTKVLICDEKPHGTHPTPKEACDEIKELVLHGEDGDALCPCPKNLDPVGLDVGIIIEDEVMTYPFEFANTCMFHCQTKPLKKFFSIGLVPDDYSSSI